MIQNNGKYGFLFISLNQWNRRFIKAFIQYHREQGDVKLPPFVVKKQISEYKVGELKRIYKRKTTVVLTSNEYADLLQLECLFIDNEMKTWKR